MKETEVKLIASDVADTLALMTEEISYPKCSFRFLSIPPLKFSRRKRQSALLQTRSFLDRVCKASWYVPFAEWYNSMSLSWTTEKLEIRKQLFHYLKRNIQGMETDYNIFILQKYVKNLSEDEQQSRASWPTCFPWFLHKLRTKRR